MRENDGRQGSKNERSHLLLKGNCLKVLDKIPNESCRLVITSPPYNIGKEYERDTKFSVEEYKDWIAPIIEKSCDKVAKNGSICWQVGNYVKNGEIVPLDYIVYEIVLRKGLKLRNRIVWHFNFGLHAKKRFSGRYETLLWFTKSDSYLFSLDPVRVPQLYPGKRHSLKRALKPGHPSGNPNGKNPSDFWMFDAEAAFKTNPIWELPNVKANHPEKTIHPCQFPSELAERCILALTEVGDRVLDPFVGTGTSVIAAAKHNRIGIGIEQDQRYINLARKRLSQHSNGVLVTRPLGKPVRKPSSRERVAMRPTEWNIAAE